jgi:membrane-associated protein
MSDINSLLRTVGYAGIFGIIFAESGLLAGFFLPGDSLLFTAGFLASQGVFNIVALCVITFLAAVIGDNVGYHFGKKVGPRAFKKEDSLVFSKENVERSQEFFKRHGGKSIILARFIPLGRTFTPVIAGIGKMDYKRFFAFNIIGGFIWAVGVTLLGYFLGSVIPDVDKYLLPIAALIILVTIVPGLWHLLKDQEKRVMYISHAKKSIHKVKNRKAKK